MKVWAIVATGCSGYFSYHFHCFSVGFSGSLGESVVTGCSGHFSYHLHYFSANFWNFL